LYPGKEDSDLITIIAKENGVLVTKDSDFKKIQLHMALMKEHGLGTFFFHHPKAMDKWAELQYFSKAWPNIRNHVLKKHKPPYLIEFKTNGILRDLAL
jgi:hypothetical protein